MTKPKKNGITIANLIALIGLAGIAVVTFFGNMFHSQDGTPGAAILAAFALLAGLTFLLVMSIKAKSAESNPDKWIYVEYLCVVAYIAVAVLFASPFLRFFYVMTENENLKAMANTEVSAIKTMYSSYEHQYRTALKNAVEQIQNYRDSEMLASVDSELSDYIKTVGNLDDWERKANACLALDRDEELLNIEERIDVWNLLDLPSLAADLEERGRAAWSRVEKHIMRVVEDNRLIPLIEGGGVNPYSFNGYAKFDLGSAPQPKFAESLRAANGSTPMGWIIYVILNLMVLLNYLVTNRTNYVSPRKGTKTQGTEL